MKRALYRTLQSAVVPVLVTLSLAAHAGQYVCDHSNFDIAGCAKHIRDIVTDKFTARYPASKFQIVVISDFSSYSDGGGTGFAVAGVSPTISGEIARRALLPSRKFLATIRIDPGRHITAAERTKQEIALIRRAVDALMNACDQSETCDVLN